MPQRTDPDALTRSFLARLEQEHRGQDNLRARTTAVRAGIKGGQVTRLSKNWQPPRQSANRALRESPLLLARARDLAWNEPYVGAAIEEIAKNVVGCGIQSAAAVASDDPDGFDDEFNSEADLAWQDYADNWCDATGEMTFDELLAVLLKEVVEAGEVFLLEISDPNPERPVPMAFQVVDPEQLDESRDRVAGPGVNKIDRGIEFDAQGRRVAYYLFDEHPDDAPTLARSTRYPAERVIHLFRPRRANQSRGATWLHLLIQTLKDMGWYLENELQGSAVAALFTVLIKRAQGAGTGLGLNAESGETADAVGNPLEELGPGIIADLGKDDSVEIVNPNRPSANAGPWIDLLLRMIARGIGLSYLRLTNDYSKASYSSARASDLSDRQFFRPLQKWLGRRIVWEIRKRWTRQMAAMGRFKSCSPREFLADPSHWIKIVIRPPGWDWVDPTKEVNASLDALEGNLTTLEEVTGAKGKDWRELLRQRKRENDFAAKLSLKIGRPTPPPPTLAAPVKPAPDDDDPPPADDDQADDPPTSDTADEADDDAE